MDPLVFDVADFCDRHRISRAKFYELLKEGLAPDCFNVGRRRLISGEAAARWRKAMEARAMEGRV